ncbi:MAG: MoxR family ATPase, partial [Nanoarchaeota archaeon]
MNTKELTKSLLQEKDPFIDIIGQDNVKESLKSALLSDRHIILVGPPGIGKTTLAKNIAKLLGEKTPFVRVQGSPDLTVEDLLGDIDPIKALKYGPLSIEAFTKGKIFKANKGILFFDELNRCPEKVQNALLQVLEEKKATIGSYDVDFDIDFIFVGTENPEDTSTEKLSDVLLDRFDLIYMHYPETTE